MTWGQENAMHCAIENMHKSRWRRRAYLSRRNGTCGSLGHAASHLCAETRAFYGFGFCPADLRMEIRSLMPSGEKL